MSAGVITGRRTRPGTAATAVALLAAGLLAAYVLLWLRLGHDDLAGGDFSASYVAAQSWRAGDAAQLYDQAAENARHQLLLPGFRIDLPFITPPTTALLAAPLTALSADAAARVAGLAELLLVAAAVALALRATPRAAADMAATRVTAGLAALAGPGTCVLLWQAQWDGLCALGLAAGYAALRAQRLVLAGLAVSLGFLPVKPHLAAGIAVFLAVAYGARALAGMALGAVATFAAGLAVGGAGVWRDWLGAVGLSSGHSPLASLLGYTGLAGSWLGDTTAARALGLIASAAAVLACAVIGLRVRGRPDRLEPALAGAAALSLAAAPHLLSHDLAVVAPVAAIAFAWALSLRPGGGPELVRVSAIWGGLCLAALLDLGNGAPAPPGRLVPWALTAAGAAAFAAVSRTGTASERPAPAPARVYSGSGSGAGGLADQS